MSPFKKALCIILNTFWFLTVFSTLLLFKYRANISNGRSLENLKLYSALISSIKFHYKFKIITFSSSIPIQPTCSGSFFTASQINQCQLADHHDCWIGHYVLSHMVVGNSYKPDVENWMWSGWLQVQHCLGNLTLLLTLQI